MAAYVVEVLRTERIFFEIDAADREDAERRYLMDGDETGSESVESEPEIVSVTRAEDRKGTER
jgi:hypothetical protein